MKRALMFAIMGIVLLFGVNVSAQDEPSKIEVGVDYSLAYLNPSTFGSPFNVNGGGGSLVYFPAHWFGIKMDLQGYGSHNTDIVIPAGNTVLPKGGTFNVEGNLFTYMFGPEIKKRGRFEPYGQLLFGGAHSNFYGNLSTASGSASTAPSNNAFAMTVGLGLDIHINRMISIRPGEVGYLLTRFGNAYANTNQNSLRYVAGVTFNFK